MDLARITFPYLILICLAALLSGVLNGLGRFAAAAGGADALQRQLHRRDAAADAYVPTVGHALAWGVSAAGVAQLALLAWATRRAGMSLAIPRPRLTPAMRHLLRRMGPGLVGASAMQLNQVVDVIVGSLLPPGAISLLYYADRVNQLPLGTIGAAVGTALLPLLSREVRGPDPAAAIATLNRALEFALVLTVPAALALIVSGYPILVVLFERGAFSPESALLASQSLAAYALGLPFFVLVKVLAPAFFARGDTSTPVRIGMLTLVLNFALNLALFIPLQHVGPALATSLAAIFNVAGLAVMLQRRGFLRSRRPAAAGGCRASRWPRSAMAAALWLVRRGGVDPAAFHGAARWAALAALIGAGLRGLWRGRLGARRVRRAAADPAAGAAAGLGEDVRDGEADARQRRHRQCALPHGGDRRVAAAGRVAVDRRRPGVHVDDPELRDAMAGIQTGFHVPVIDAGSSRTPRPEAGRRRRSARRSGSRPAWAAGRGNPARARRCR